MSPNERARQNILRMAREIPALRARLDGGGPRSGLWVTAPKLGALQPIDTSGFPTRRPAVQPAPSGGGFLDTILGTVSRVGTAIAGSYADREIAEHQARALRDQMKAEIQRAELENQRARQQAEAQRNALAADQYQRELLEAQQAELNLDKLFSSPLVPAGIGLAALGVLWMIARA